MTTELVANPAPTFGAGGVHCGSCNEIMLPGGHHCMSPSARATRMWDILLRVDPPPRRRRWREAVRRVAAP